MPRKRRWRGPSIKEVAEHAGLGTATVDRALNDRGNVRERTKRRVYDAFETLRSRPEARRLRITFFAEAGASFIQSLEEAVTRISLHRPDLVLSVSSFASYEVKTLPYAQLIERESASSDGVVITSRQDASVTRAVRAIRSRGIPVVCLATDLPRSGRNGYVGSNERSSGAAAGKLMGDLNGGRQSSVLLLASAAYRAAEQREEGFRDVLRKDYPEIGILQRADIRDNPDIAYLTVQRFIQTHGPPDGIYSIAGGNTGIGRSLVENKVHNEVTFIGHELNANSRALLRSGAMNYLIARDQELEVTLCLSMIDSIRSGRSYQSLLETNVRIVCKHNC